MFVLKNEVKGEHTISASPRQYLLEQHMTFSKNFAQIYWLTSRSSGGSGPAAVKDAPKHAAAAAPPPCFCRLASTRRCLSFFYVFRESFFFTVWYLSQSESSWKGHMHGCPNTSTSRSSCSTVLAVACLEASRYRWTTNIPWHANLYIASKLYIYQPYKHLNVIILQTKL